MARIDERRAQLRDERAAIAAESYGGAQPLARNNDSTGGGTAAWSAGPAEHVLPAAPAAAAAAGGRERPSAPMVLPVAMRPARSGGAHAAASARSAALPPRAPAPPPASATDVWYALPHRVVVQPGRAGKLRLVNCGPVGIRYLIECKAPWVRPSRAGGMIAERSEETLRLSVVRGAHVPVGTEAVLCIWGGPATGRELKYPSSASVTVALARDDDDEESGSVGGESGGGGDSGVREVRAAPPLQRQQQLQEAVVVTAAAAAAAAPPPATAEPPRAPVGVSARHDGAGSPPGHVSAAAAHRQEEEQQHAVPHAQSLIRALIADRGAQARAVAAGITDATATAGEIPASVVVGVRVPARSPAPAAVATRRAVDTSVDMSAQTTPSLASGRQRSRTAAAGVDRSDFSVQAGSPMASFRGDLTLVSADVAVAQRGGGGGAAAAAGHYDAAGDIGALSGGEGGDYGVLVPLHERSALDGGRGGGGSGSSGGGGGGGGGRRGDGGGGGVADPPQLVLRAQRPHLPSGAALRPAPAFAAAMAAADDAGSVDSGTGAPLWRGGGGGGGGEGDADFGVEVPARGVDAPGWRVHGAREERGSFSNRSLASSRSGGHASRADYPPLHSRAPRARAPPQPLPAAPSRHAHAMGSARGGAGGGGSAARFDGCSAQFPDTPVGRTSEVLCKLVNPSDGPVRLTLRDVRPPFGCAHRSVKLRARSFCMLPLRFSPGRAGTFTDAVWVHAAPLGGPPTGYEFEMVVTGAAPYQ